MGWGQGLILKPRLNLKFVVILLLQLSHVL